MGYPVPTTCHTVVGIHQRPQSTALGGGGAVTEVKPQGTGNLHSLIRKRTNTVFSSWLKKYNTTNNSDCNEN